MMLRFPADAIRLWLAVGVAVLACCTAMPWSSTVASRSDANRPAELIPGEYRGPTIEQVIEYFDGSDPESIMTPDEAE